MPQDLETIWPTFHDALRRAVPESTYDVWLAPLVPGTLDDTTLTVLAPPGIEPWVGQRYVRVLRDAARDVLGRDVEVLVAGTRHGAERPQPTAPAVAEAAAPELELNPKFSFGQFVIGDANRFAHAAALAVAEHPGQAYNPLFVYGPPGVGKTHLLHSIGNYVTAYGDGLRVRYTTVERFTNEFVAALQARGRAVDAFKARYRHNDVLLIDDVQFLESKAKTEEEFFHTFNALYDTGAQLVFTSDRTPANLDALHDRLRERFQSGLVADITSPDPAMRVAVLRKRAQQDDVDLDDADGVFSVIADRVEANVRALEAAFIRVVAFGSLQGRAVDAELATRVLDDLYPRSERPFRREVITVARIQDLVCEAFALTRDELLSSTKEARVAWPRQIAMFLAREQTSETLPAIGKQFGGRSHTTVMHACKRTAERLAIDTDAHTTVDSITRRLRGDHTDRPS